jgi:hypothetical protein
MEFAQVEAKFKELKRKHEANVITEEEFKAQLEELMIQDEEGRWWMIGYETGKWHCHDGEKWVRAEPPRVAGLAAPPSMPDIKARLRKWGWRPMAIVLLLTIIGVVLIKKIWLPTRPPAPGTFLLKWGSRGSGDGQFDGPKAIAVDVNGNVYVADAENHRIQKFDPSGNFIAKWGSHCELSTGESCVDPDGDGPLELGDGQFNNPIGVAIDARGHVYVADTGNDRIQKFDAKGKFLAKWGSCGNGNGQFHWPLGVAVDAKGNVYVADSDNHRIQVFDSDGSFITKWGSHCELSTGEGCVDPDGDGPLELGDGKFYYGPGAVAMGANGNVYAVDSHNHRIQKFWGRQ